MRACRGPQVTTPRRADGFAMFPPPPSPKDSFDAPILYLHRAVKMKHRAVIQAILALCALSPLGAMLLLQRRESLKPMPLTWPQWEMGNQVIDPLAISAALAYVGAAWFFERMVWAAPALRGFQLVWVSLFAGGITLFIMGQLIPGFAGIVGLALIGKAFESRRDESKKRQSAG